MKTTPPPGSAPANTAPRYVTPPSGWALKSQYGQLSCGAGHGDRLARLEDVAKFVMECYDMPPVDAVAWLCDSLEAETPELFLLNEGGTAKALPAAHSFFSIPVVSFWDEQPKGENDPANCGMSGAVKHMRQYWNTPELGNAKVHGIHVLAPLAVRLDDAFDLWGYGSLEPAHKAPGTVHPVDGWQQEHALGFLRFDPTPDGRLVRLADVVRWLQSSDALPRKTAVQALCDGLNAGALRALYKVAKGEYAVRVAPNHAYGYHTIATLKKANDDAKAAALTEARRASWNAVAPTHRRVAVSVSRPSGKIHEPVTPGLPALRRRICDLWLPHTEWKGEDVLDLPKPELSRLAIRIDVAYALWGWGSVASVMPLRVAAKQDEEPKTWAALVQFVSSHKNAMKWTVERKQILVAEFNRRSSLPSSSGVAASMAKEVGISVSRFNGLKKAATDAGKRNASNVKTG